MGLHPEGIAGVRDTGRNKPGARIAHAGVRGRAKAQTGQTALRVHKLPARLGKQEPCMGPHPETAAGVRGWVKTQTRCANCPPQARGRARLGKGTNPVRVLPHRRSRVRARHGDEINPVRELLTAGARACEAGQRHKPGARLAHRRCAGDKAACADSPAPGRRVRVLLTAGVRACEAGQRHKPGARLARRRRAGDKAACADSPAPGRRVRDLPAAGARACEAGQRHKPGARLAHRRCAGDKRCLRRQPCAGTARARLARRRRAGGRRMGNGKRTVSAER